MSSSKKPVVNITTEDGEKYNIPVEGSLGLLAAGYKGLLAWREVKKQHMMKVMEKRMHESQNPNAE